MARHADGSLMRQFRALYNLGVVGERTDGQLLERFATASGEAAELAFAAMVERHGPMVLRICRGILRDPNDVEDAFQATFLVLVRKARSLWVDDSLGPWLHRVARRVALRARAEASRRRERERRAAEARPAMIPDDVRDDGLVALIHEEIDRLPERCRVPVVLCDVQGLTHEQAARHLGWPIGTVKSRLTGGRERLRARLARRGVAPAVAMLRTMTAPARTASAAVPAGLMEATVRSARLVAAGAGPTAAGAVPATVNLLMEGALDAMFMTRISIAVLACGLFVGGAVAVAQQAGRRPQAPTSRPANVRAVAPAAVPADEPADGQADLAKEMAQLELGLLEDEVKLLRSQVGDTLKAKIEYETGVTRVDPRAGEEAQLAYDKARVVYLDKARELAKLRRRVGKVEEPKKAEPGAPGDDRPADRKGPGTGSNAGGAIIGSIDMAAVHDGYERVRRYRPPQADGKEAAARIRKLQAEVQDAAARLRRYVPDSADYRAGEEMIRSLQAQIYREGREYQIDREAAGVLKDIEEAIAAVARARGLDYVVKVSPGARPGARSAEVINAMNRPILYANPRNDITEDVIRELNRRFAAR